MASGNAVDLPVPVEASLTTWLRYPWHIVHSALRRVACQEWQSQHVCPICAKSDRNTGGVHNAWAYFDGCLTHLSTAPRCIGYLLNEDPLYGRGKSMIPSVADLLGELFPNQHRHERLPASDDHHIHGTRRSSSSMANVHFCRLSWLVLQTRGLALTSFQSAVQKSSGWYPKCYKGSRVARAPPPPIKFLDIGTKMGCYEIGDHIPGEDDNDLWEMEFQRPTPLVL